MRGKEEEWRRLMLAARLGDEAAYRALLRDLASYIRSWARPSMRGHDCDLEDVVQETLLAVHLKRHTWHADEAFSPWLRAIVRHKAIDALRRGARSNWLPIDEYADSLAGPQDSKGLEHRDIVTMADSLPGRQRELVVAMFVHGHSTAEAASRFGMSQGAVRVTLHRALGKLAKRFGTRA